MPSYSYECQACGKRFSTHMTMAEHDKEHVKCPKCGSRKVEQDIALFAAHTSKKS